MQNGDLGTLFRNRTHWRHLSVVSFTGEKPKRQLINYLFIFSLGAKNGPVKKTTGPVKKTTRPFQGLQPARRQAGRGPFGPEIGTPLGFIAFWSINGSLASRSVKETTRAVKKTTGGVSAVWPSGEKNIPEKWSGFISPQWFFHR